MAEEEKVVQFTVLYRGKSMHLNAMASATLGALGSEIVDLTGVAPHTLRLMLPKRPPLQPMSEQHSSMLIHQSGITEGLKIRMMGVSSAEVAAVSQPAVRDQRILGFSEEEERSRQRSDHSRSSSVLPKGNYVFCDFRTLDLPGVELNPPAAMALKIMHKLASDRGIIAIMNKHRWRVGVMTELAPVGYVGVSPKCILGFNRNRGQEISLRLRTDDLKGFRKYDSIKKTLLHELAHMVHDEHDEQFHALDKKLNEEAVALDWTKAHGHTLSRIKFDNEDEETYTGNGASSSGHRLGGDVARARILDPREAAAAAALRRLGNGPEFSQQAPAYHSKAEAKPVAAEPDPDENEIRSSDMLVDISSEVGSTVVIHSVGDTFGKEQGQAKKAGEAGGRGEPDPDAADMVFDTHVSNQEPDPDLAIARHAGKDEPDPDLATARQAGKDEPDPDEAKASHTSNDESDPDAHMGKYEPDPDEASAIHASKGEPDPDETSAAHAGEEEPDPDEVSHMTLEASADLVLDREVRSHGIKDEPDADETVDNGQGDVSMERAEPDPDASDIQTKFNGTQRNGSVHNVLHLAVKCGEPDPDEMAVLPCKDEPDPDAAGDKNTIKSSTDICTCRSAAKRAKNSAGKCEVSVN